MQFRPAANEPRATTRLAVCLTFLFLPLALASSSVQAQTTWNSATSGNWSDSTLWNPQTVPDSGTTDVVIDATGSDYTVTLGSNETRTVNNLTIDSANATLTLGDAAGFGELSVGPGGGMTIASGSNVELKFGIINGAVVNDGTINSDAPFTFSQISGPLTNNGSVITSGLGNQLDLNDVVNSASGTISANTSSKVNLIGDWSNSGTVNVDATSQIDLGGNFNNTDIGTITVTSGGVVAITGMLDNTVGTFSGGPGYQLQGGTISGGTLDNNNLVFAYGELNDVDVTGGLDLPQFNSVVLSNGSTVMGDISVAGSAFLELQQDLSLVAGQTITLGDALGNVGDVFVGTGNILTVDAGALMTGKGSVGGDSTVQIDGELSPGVGAGEIGFLQFDSDAAVSLSSTSKLSIELGGTNPGDFDEIFAGQLSLGGVLDISLVNGFTLDAGQSFEFLTADTSTGMFAGLGDGDTILMSNGYDLRVDYNFGAGGNNIRLFTTLSAVPEPSSAAILGLAFAVVTTRRKRRTT